MKARKVYVGIDVDDTAFHLAGFDLSTETFYEYTCKPNIGALCERLDRIKERGFGELHICYEATYLGFSLCRQLLSRGYQCEVIAPSLIPKLSSDRVKTDKIDSRKLAEYYAKNLLTAVHLPSQEDEQLRRLIRSRSFQVSARKRLKQHVLSYCRVLGIDYKGETQSSAHHWTKQHMEWLVARIKKLDEIDRWTLDNLLLDLTHCDTTIAQFEEKIEACAQQERYQKKCVALNCFKGIQTLSAMTVISELGDIRRFAHPKKIVSYAGMDIAEYSSGGKEKKRGMTKMGNHILRTVLIEACQTITPGTTVGKQLRARRGVAPKEINDIAARCQARLYTKKWSMQRNGKHTNKIKAACAREMIGFIWEALMAVV